MLRIDQDSKRVTNPVIAIIAGVLAQQTPGALYNEGEEKRDDNRPIEEIVPEIVRIASPDLAKDSVWTHWVVPSAVGDLQIGIYEIFTFGIETEEELFKALTSPVTDNLIGYDAEDEIADVPYSIAGRVITGGALLGMGVVVLHNCKVGYDAERFSNAMR